LEIELNTRTNTQDLNMESYGIMQTSFNISELSIPVEFSNFCIKLLDEAILFHTLNMIIKN